MTSLSEFNTMDSFKGPNIRYSYDEIEELLAALQLQIPRALHS